jgi:hypothetical protein
MSRGGREDDAEGLGKPVVTTAGGYVVVLPFAKGRVVRPRGRKAEPSKPIVPAVLIPDLSKMKGATPAGPTQAETLSHEPRPNTTRQELTSPRRRHTAPLSGTKQLLRQPTHCASVAHMADPTHEQARSLPSPSGVYNLLSDVETADAELSRRGRLRLLENLSNVIRRHKVSSRFGIRLLHRHNTISGQETMLEDEEYNPKLGHCLVTVATDASQVKTPVGPNSWQLCDGAYVPLEWSTDLQVASIAAPLATFGSFFRDFAGALAREDASHLLGPCIIARTFALRRPSPTSIFIETCEEVRRANVIRFDEPARYAPHTLVQTTWVVATSTAETECNATCIPSGCNPVSACVVGSEGHTSQTTHTTGNHAAVHG